MRSEDLRLPARRLAVVRLALTAAFAVLAARAAHLAVVDQRGAERGAEQVVTTLELGSQRGIIADRTGAELAVSVQAPSVYVLPGAVADPEHVARELAHLLGWSPRKVRDQLRRPSPFVFLSRWVAPGLAERVRALGLEGVGVVHEPMRVYPHHGLAASLIGFSNLDGRGVRGIEEMEDDWLRGAPLTLPVERDARRQILAIAGYDPNATAGGDVALAIDLAFQADVEAALDTAIADTQAQGGVVIALDPGTGDVLALAERPSFDPNDFRKLPFERTRSRAFLDAFEPGSTFKMFTVAGALEAGVTRPDEVFDCSGLRVPGKTVTDAHPHGALSVTGILEVSSNVGATRLGQRLGPAAHFETLAGFGFGRPSGSGFPHESSGLLRSWRSWRPVDHATVSFGQGVSVTPIQLAAATAAIASGGVYRTPRLVTARRQRAGAWEAVPVAAGRRVLSERTARQVLDMMEAVVSGPRGTGKRASIPGVRVGGKTGTAQKLDPATHTYHRNRYLAWFVGVAPIDAPELVILVQLDEVKRGGHTGGAAAAPLFARVASAQLARMGHSITPAPERSEPTVAVATSAPDGGVEAGPNSRPAGAVEAVASVDGRLLLPDFSGLTLGEARRLAEGSDLVLDVEGHGRAIAQDPAPGTILAGAARRVRIRFDARPEEI
jgi:cell division protein FtsI (penicillin-binding protein 3)